MVILKLTDLDDVLVRTTQGLLVALCHGGKDGLVDAPQWALEQADLVMCCYPKQVRARTGLPTIGGWSGRTAAWLRGDTLRICPAAEADRLGWWD